jgi:hypothetical protein
MRTRHLNGLLIVAILIISTTPLYAQRREQNASNLKTDARNVVGIIGGDKTKTQAYCQMLDLTAELDRANREKRARRKVLSQKMDQLPPASSTSLWGELFAIFAVISGPDLL